MTDSLPFDAIYVLSCPKYLKTRVPKVMHQLKALGFDAVPVHTVITPKSVLIHDTLKRHSWWRFGEYVAWCAFGHCSAMNDTVCRGYKRALILEDDVRFMNDSEKLLKRLSTMPEDCDIAMLDWVAKKAHSVRSVHGKNPDSEWEPPMCNFVSASAYMVSAKAATCFLQKHNETVGPHDSHKLTAADNILLPTYHEEFKLKELLAMPVLCRQYTVSGAGPTSGRFVNKYSEQHSNDKRFSEEDYKWPFP